MKTCPACYKTYDDSWQVCLHDNSKLVEGQIQKPDCSKANAGMEPKTGKTVLLKIGIVLFPIGLVANIVFMNVGIHGILRELSRLSTLVGLLLLIFGGIYSLIKK